jgi:rhamnose transport system substrate-binding protein
MSSKPRALLVTLAVASGAMAIAACGSSSSDSSAPAGNAKSASAGDKNCAKGPVKVGFVPKLATDPYWAAARKGTELAKKEIGGDFVLQAPSEATADAQVEIINNMITQKVGVIAVAGNDPDAVVPALKRAAKAGIKVISYDSDVAPQGRTLFANQADLSAVGEKLLQSMGALLDHKGDFATLTDGAAVTNQNAWLDSIEAGLKDPKYKGMKFLRRGYGDANEQTYEQQTLALVRAYPNLKGLIVPAGIGLPAAARALEQAKLLGTKIKLTGLAPASIMRKYIKQGSVQDIWWNVPNLGYLTYYAAQALAQCKVTGAQGETIEVGALGTRTIGKNGEVLLGPADIVTSKNISTFPF